MLVPDPGMRLKPQIRKIVESLLFLIEEAGKRGHRPTQYDIVKSVFIADYWHMNKYGRPITFDNHVAMEHGPVPSVAYDMLKSRYNWKAACGWDGAPFAMRPYPEMGPTVNEFYAVSRSPDLRVLSKSDIKFLGEALDYVIKHGFTGVKDWTHELPAYQAAWNKRGGSLAEPMDLASLLESKDEEDAEAIAFASRHLA